MAETDTRLPEEDRAKIRPDIPGLRTQEGVGTNTTGRSSGGASDSTTGSSGGARDSTVGSEGGARDSAGGGAGSRGLAAAERSPGLATNTAGQIGRGFIPADALSTTGALKAFMKRNRRKGIAGGAVGAVVIILAIAGFSAVVEYELVNIEKVLLHDVAKIEQHFEKKAAQDVMQKIIKRLQEKTKGTPEEKEEIAQEDSSGGELTNDIDKFPITKPEVVDALAKQGITVETDSNGNFTGLKDAAGNDITGKVGTDSALFDSIETAMPEWNLSQIESYEPLMTEHAGSTFDGVPEDTAPDDVDKTVEGDITNGASSEDIISAESGQESEGDQPTKDTPPATASAVDLNNQAGGALGEALNTTNQALANGESGEQATEAGVDSFNLGDPVFASTLATMACNLKSGITAAAKARVPLIMELLTRHFTRLLSLADQLKTGTLQGGTLNKVMQIFNGDPSATATKSDPRPEASLPFSASAGWQEATGGSVDTNPEDAGSSSFTPDISKAALPTANTGTEIVNEVNGVANKIPGANLSCTVLTSGFGFIVQGIAGIGQLIGDIGSFGTSQVAITAGILGVQETLKQVVLPDIIKYFTPVGIYGGEDSVQWLNNSRAGGVASYSDYARSNGGEPLTNTQANTLTTEASNDAVVANEQQSWTNRTFALSNPDSLAAHLAMDIPTSFQQLTLGFASFFTNFPTALSHSFGDLLIPHQVSALTAPQNPGEEYGITEYALMDNQVAKYDPIQNEQYLNTTICYGTNCAKRITLDGDPNSYQDGAVDSSTTDLLHCFNQGYDDGTNPTASEPSYDPICSSLGNYDYNVLPPRPINDTANGTDGTKVSDNNVAVSYCAQLDHESPSAAQNDDACLNAVIPHIYDDIGHFQQYIVDTHVMNSYKDLAD